MYLATQTRFDITYPVQRLAEYNSKPTLIAFESIIQILRYLAGDTYAPFRFQKHPSMQTTLLVGTPLQHRN